MPWILDLAVPVGHNSLLPRETPKIKGSSSAFVGLVVALALIIVIASSAVIYLIREPAPGSDRRERIRRYQASSGLEGGGGGPCPLESRRLPFKFRKLTSVVGRPFWRSPKKNKSGASPSGSSKSGSKGSGQGWVQAAEDSDYDSSGGDSGGQRPSSRLQPDRPQQMSEVIDVSACAAAASAATAGLPVSIHESRGRVPSPQSDTSFGTSQGTQITQIIPYPDPLSPKPQRSLPSIYTHLSQPSLSPPSPSLLAKPAEVASPDALPNNHLEGYSDGKGRLFATQSGVSMLTLEGGTKFIEEL